MLGEITTGRCGSPQSRMEQGSSLFGMCVALSSSGQWPAPLLRSAERTTKEQLEESRLKTVVDFALQDSFRQAWPSFVTVRLHH
jgi:hypothetical protein